MRHQTGCGCEYFAGARRGLPASRSFPWPLGPQFHRPGQSPEVRKEFRSIRLANCPRTLAALRELRIARANLAAAQQASPFDEAAVKDAMAAVRTATTNVQAKVQDYLLTALKRPSPLPEVDAGGACPPKVSDHRRTAGLQTR
ncbi:MAG: periplasmic heavy metal sensor [Mesorhizobium sp.]|nr:MAG: periplasmic heavy metal sensor [Mesorhizobium sp.]